MNSSTFVAAAACLLESLAAFSQEQPVGSTDALQRDSLDPPASARPRVWWHRMNGNITREGIQSDLEWIKRSSIGGLLDYDDADQSATSPRSGANAWHPPYEVVITGAVNPGANTLEIKVTNLWVNRLIGDQQPGAKKYTFTVMATCKAGAPLRPSGLLGPVATSKVN